jgi:ABC-type nitrate/sulfonate/bicarbonate transport system ATPase subunit
MRGELADAAGPDRGLVFQSYSLMPWLTVFDNVALAVDSVFARESRQQRHARTEKYVRMVGLGHAMDRRPAELSGGMRQRVAVARALATSPEFLLLDEPLSALDALTRAKLQDEIESIWREEKKTVVLVTNDVDEALLLADRIIPLNPGPRATLGPEFLVNLPRPENPPWPMARSNYRTSCRSPRPTSCRRRCARPTSRSRCPTPTNTWSSTTSTRSIRRRRGRSRWSKDSISTSSAANVSR